MGKLVWHKTRALAVHLALSALIFLPFLYLMWWRWFPPPFFFTDGGWQGVRIILFVDFVIGPTLTFLVFNPAKSRRALGFDFACIGLIQTAALVYGYVTVETQRVQAVAFHQGRFQAATKTPFGEQVIEAGTWERLGQAPPYWVFVREPDSADEQAGALAWAFSETVASHEIAFLYEPLSAHWPAVRAHAVAWQEAAAPQPIAALCAAAAARNADVGAPVCLELRGYFRPAALLFDEKGTLLGWEVGAYGSASLD